MALTSPGDLQQGDKGNVHKQDRKEKPMTKIIVRRLPPGITQDDFITQVSPIPEYNYMYTTKGDMSLGENAFSRVYINFTHADDIYNFKEKFDNYVFVDTKGHEYPAVVEFAAFQKIPKRRNKARTDLKSNTIETDPVYVEFLESLKVQPSSDEKPEYSYQPSTENKTADSTPLLDFVKQRRLDKQRIREEKREERKRKDIERKRIKDDERRKRFEEKSPSKTVIIRAQKSEESKEDKQGEVGEKKEAEAAKSSNSKEKGEEKEKEKEKHFSKYKERKFEDRNAKPGSAYKSKYSKTDREYGEKREFNKSKRDDYRDYRNKPFEEYKKDTEKFPKKVKKYSERREERKSALKKSDATEDSSKGQQESSKEYEEYKEESRERKSSESSVAKNEDQNENRESRSRASDSENEREGRSKNKENDPRLQRRIRNKDRPTMAIYQPGMLRKKGPDAPDEKPSNKAASDKESWTAESANKPLQLELETILSNPKCGHSNDVLVLVRHERWYFLEQTVIKGFNRLHAFFHLLALSHNPVSQNSDAVAWLIPTKNTIFKEWYVGNWNERNYVLAYNLQNSTKSLCTYYQVIVLRIQMFIAIKKTVIAFTNKNRNKIKFNIAACW